MILDFRCGREAVPLELPDGAEVYRSKYPPPPPDEAAAVMAAVRAPLGAAPLPELLRRREAGDVVIVVSDITRPVPYPRFLAEFCGLVEECGVRREEILILVATGLHRLCSAGEHLEMLGPEVAGRYRVINHDAADPSLFVDLPEPSKSGTPVRLNRHFMGAGFRILTGLVEPHFMAGFSGGRKSVFPGLADLAGLKHFHGHRFLEDPRSRNGNLAGNPLHEESLSVARAAGVDFSLNVVLDGRRRLVRAFAGGLVPAHEAACAFARSASCLPVVREAEAAVTSCGGYPLDATFYQCVKGLVSVLPAVKPGGTIIAVGGCETGIGSPEYAGLMTGYSGRWRDFLADIRRPDFFIKDQWQFQMHCRALERVGEANLRFVTPGLPLETVERLSVSTEAVGPGGVRAAFQRLVDAAAGKSLAVFPEGPYCAPVRD